MKTIIIGAGFAGISAGITLKKNYIILEKEDRPGGMCRSEKKNGFLFDYTGHLLHLRDPETEKFIRINSGAVLDRIERRSFIYSSGVYTGYPYQANNYGLPPEIMEENITGFMRAKLRKRKNTDNFKDWVLDTFGAGIAKNFMFPYNRKLWKYPLSELTLKWLGRFVPSPDISEVIDGILAKGAANTGYNASFYYPRSGGIETVIKGMFEKVKKNTRTGKEAVSVDLKNKKVKCACGAEYSYDKLISTMPLKKFMRICGSRKLSDDSKKLKAVSVYSLNLGFKEKKGPLRHWVYVPEKEIPFYRMGFPHTFARSNAPAGYSSVFTEVSFRGKIPENAEKKVIKGLMDMGIIGSPEEIAVKLPLVLKDAYVIYNIEREKIVPKTEEFLRKRNVLLAGRWGKWEYSSMEDAVMEGADAAKKLNSIKGAV
ncbi:MAG: protoporphyrinogen/coproporphyrinogen oxidase [Candidatus Goldiibacteriota bacterium]